MLLMLLYVFFFAERRAYDAAAVTLFRRLRQLPRRRC